jgi:FkbM family methyltransferase
MSQEAIGTDRMRVALPDGRELWCVDGGDALSMWREIFLTGVYDAAVGHLRPGDTVLDIGAHLGLASLRFADRAQPLRIIACEPAPPTFDCLEANLREHAPGSVARKVAVGAGTGETTLVHYSHPAMSTMSTTVVDDEETRFNVDTILSNRGNEDAAERREWVDDMLASASSYTVPLVTVSQLVAEHGIEEIALLKVDVERAELEVLAGIGEEVWPRIHAVVMEVHRIDDRLATVEALLTRHGFAVEITQESAMTGTTVHTVRGARHTG